jgi:glucose-6-phosphate isomerase/transaldolase/glucose-6-phosphate isomerase
MSLYAHFRALVDKTRGNRGGAQFIAITDPGTGLAALAREQRFRDTFVNPPDIGGRYSVLSYFGLVPAALLGLDLAALLGRGIEMARACGAQVPPQQNPGARLGAVMGTLGRLGRDKVTLLASPKIKSYGLWAEQLLAESTGKEGKGLVPVAEEPLGKPSAYGEDRLFVYLRLNGDANTVTDRQVKALEKSGQPVVRLELRDRYDLAAEFFRWEFATAVAGRALGIHPFDQPNVQESKENTSRILEEFKTRGRLPEIPSGGSLADLLAQARPGRYLAVLAYLRFSSKADQAVKTLRRTLLVRHRLTTTAGYGPRYLHSTGQLHKGGPPSGLFLQLVERMVPDLPIPGVPYTFGILAQAQAAGDYQSLQAHGRPVVRVDLGPQGPAGIAGVARVSTRRGARVAAKRPVKRAAGKRSGAKRKVKRAARRRPRSR